ncbi:MAG: hypothetical protein WAO98_02375 [Alphaproteobacteria bacterium]
MRPELAIDQKIDRLCPDLAETPHPRITMDVMLAHPKDLYLARVSEFFFSSIELWWLQAQNITFVAELVQRKPETLPTTIRQTVERKIRLGFNTVFLDRPQSDFEFHALLATYAAVRLERLNIGRYLICRDVARTPAYTAAQKRVRVEFREIEKALVSRYGKKWLQAKRRELLARCPKPAAQP